MAASRRRRWLWRWVIGIVIVVPLVAVGGVSWWLATMDMTALKPRVEALASRALKRDVHVTGDLALALLPTPTLMAEGLRVGAIGSADSMQVRLALAPLLRGHVVLDAMTLERPILHLPRLAEATPTPARAPPAPGTQFAPPAPGTQGASPAPGTQFAPPAPGSAARTRGRIAFRRIDIDDGTVILSDGTTLGGLNAQLSQRDGTLTLAAQGRLPTTGQPATAQPGASLAVQGTLDPTDRDGGHLRATLSAPGLSIGLDGALDTADRRYEGGISVTAPDLQAAATLLSHYMTLPPLPPVRDIVLNAKVAGPWRHPEITALHLVTGGAKLDGFVPGMSLSEATLDGATLAGPFKAHASATIDGTPPRDTVLDVTLDGLPGAVPVGVTFKVASKDASVDGNGTIGWPLDRSPLALRVDAKADDLVELGALFGRHLPAGSASLAARLDAAHDLRTGWSVSELGLTSALGDLRGTLSHEATPRSLWQARLTAGAQSGRAIDVDAVLEAIRAAVTQGPTGTSSGATSPGATSPGATNPGAAARQPAPGTSPARRDRLIDDVALPKAWLRDNDAKLDLGATHLTLHGQGIDAMHVKLALAGGKLSIDPGEAAGPAGSVTLHADVDAAADPMATQMILQVPKASLGALLAAFGLPGDSEGTAKLDADLAGTGDSTAALAATVSGGFALDAGPGRIDNRVVEALFGRALQAAALPAGLSGSSDLRCLRVEGTLKDGRGALSRLALDTTRLSLDGNGTFDLGRETLDLHLRPLLRLGHGGAAIPFHVVGSFVNPKTSLDASGPDGRISLLLGALTGTVVGGGPCAAAPPPMPAEAAPAPTPAPAPAKTKPPKAAEMLRRLFGQ